MRMLREWFHRLGGTLLPGRRDADLEEELRLHLDMAAEDARRRGLDPPIRRPRRAARRPEVCRRRWMRFATARPAVARRSGRDVRHDLRMFDAVPLHRGRRW